MLIALLMMSILPGSIENLVFLASMEATFALETLETLETARDARDRSRPAETLETRRDGSGRSGRLPIGRNAPFRAGYIRKWSVPSVLLEINRVAQP